MKKRRKMLIVLSSLTAIVAAVAIYFAAGNAKYRHKIDDLLCAEGTPQVNAPVEKKLLSFHGSEIHYFVSGNRDGQAIVFLHPAFGDHACFDPQIDFFAPSYFVITIDMAGHGLTGSQGGKISETPEHVAAILEAEKIDAAHIAGVSLGSLLAQDFSLKYPDKTLSVCALGGYDINREQPLVARAQRREMGKWLFRMIFSMDAFRRYTASVTVCDEAQQARFYLSARHFTRGSFRSMSGLDELIANRPGAGEGIPLFILVGENDNDLAKTAAAQWHDDRPDSDFHIIPGAGHCANMDNPVLFNELLLNFINK